MPPWSEPWTIENSKHRLEHIFVSKGFVGLLIEENKVVQGLILGNVEPYLNESIYHLIEMCVGLEYQSQGVGKKLLTAMHRELKNKNVSGVHLMTRNDLNASKFYLANGYQLEKKEGTYGIEF